MAKRFFSAQDILTSNWFIQPGSADAFLPLVAKLLQGETPDLSAFKMFGDGEMSLPSMSVPVYYVDGYGVRNPVADAPEGSVLLMDLMGPITKYDTYCGPSGTLTKANIIQAAVDNPNIIGIVINCDSPGGQSSALEIISRVILEGKAVKPIIGYVHGYCASAGFWALSNCTEIIMEGGMSMIGSVGVYQQLLNYTKKLEAMGVKVEEFYSTLSPKKNEEYRELQKGNLEPLNRMLDALALTFRDTIKANRPQITEEAAFEGRLYFTKEAISIGMADREGTLADAINAASVQPQLITNNTYMKKIQIGAGLLSLLSFFSAKPADGATFAEADWTEDKQKELNTKLENSTRLETELQTAKNDLLLEQGKATKLAEEKTALATTVTDLEGKIAALPGGASTTATPEKKETPSAEADGAKNKVVDMDASHNQLASQMGFTIKSQS